eukprot:CAMPEP_0170594778 /NCGR_PEP_ID=MMETSP0224-20130122/14186_1 /TAXON_ID=285029 /ORGANISM="Togula jolla, Strain CCCM 725" /LENGTH=248 /DNA_ID=CAMNT_0010918867 /DNA_START=151 /DNA_END=897 /DNA_ORIENTATION=+
MGGFAVAVKTFKHSSSKDQIAAKREIAVLRMVRHPNVIRMVSVKESSGMPQIIMDFCAGGDLFTLLHRGSVEVPCAHMFGILTDVAKAMKYLHQHEPMIMHRDLKALNILLPTGYSTFVAPCVKLCDFGSSRMKVHGEEAWSSLTLSVGTLPWMAPEVSCGVYDEMCDVYSFGMVMFEVFARHIPYEGEEYKSLPALIHSGATPDLHLIPLDICDDALELMLCVWSQDPARRPSFATLLRVLAVCYEP